MKLQGFNSCSWVVGLVFGFLSLLVVNQLLWPFEFGICGESLSGGGVFSFDAVSFYLILLSSALWLPLWFWVPRATTGTLALIGVSVVSSFLCYCCDHALGFWVFYEMSIVPLLVLLVVDSPYSERFIASWYLLGYVVLTSLPMLLCLYYLSQECGGFGFRCWPESGELGFTALILLSIMFITKIPLPPFHVWLPIVHAEASSPVSVCLSGYIMKLGVLGVCRFCSPLLPHQIFSKYYLIVCFFLAILFFVSASRELDGKRWLAFLSLSHILVACGCLSVGSWSLLPVSFLYCLGHGLSAGVVFMFLWLAYEVSHTRNLSLLKASVSSSLALRVLVCMCLCTTCSLPPTVQFFCEVFLVSESGPLSGLFMAVLYGFVFFGGLIPLFLVGTLLSRHSDVSSAGTAVSSGVFSVVIVSVWSFGLFLVF